MATGTELFLGVEGRPAIEKVLAELGLQWTADDDIGPSERLDEIGVELRRAHLLALEELGLTILDEDLLRRADGRKISRQDGYVYVHSPGGAIIRRMAQWGPSFIYDKDEMGDTEDTAVFGVSLISRYFPVFLDWRLEHGGSGENVVLTSEVLRQIEIARRRIAPVLPFVADAPIIVKELFY